MRVVRHLVWLFFFAAAAYLSVVNAQATTVLQVEKGVLIGASGVNVNGKSYDVFFLDDLCANLFSGCNSSSNFTFQDSQSATNASAALINEVFVNSNLGRFDTQDMTRGCSTFPFTDCQIITPYAVHSDVLSYAVAQNAPNCFGLCDLTYIHYDEIGLVDSSVLSRYTASTFALWTPVVATASNDVPEPN